MVFLKINSIISKKDCDGIIIFIKIFIKYLKTKNILFKQNEKLEKILYLTKKKFPKEYENIILKTIQRNPNVIKIGLKKIFIILKQLGLKEPIFSTEPLIMIHSDKINKKIMLLPIKIGEVFKEVSTTLSYGCQL